MALVAGQQGLVWDSALVDALGVRQPLNGPQNKPTPPSNDNRIGLVWEPQAGPQSLAVAAPFVNELLFGGARGGGKSDFLLGDFLQDIHIGPTWRGIIFRKSYPELEELLVRAKEIYLPIGATYKVSEKTFVFPSGATLKLRHIETEGDADLYQGHQYTWIGWDELGNWPNLNAYKKLKACLRSAHDVDNKRIRCSANPGGIGHHAVKNYFIDAAPKGMQLIQNVDEDNLITTKMFIPSRVYDNKILMQNDPTYISRLREIGSPELVKAWLEGDWNVITGAYFPEFTADKHVLEPFEIPSHWMRFRSMDWGSASPFAVLWHAVSDGYQLSDGRYIPDGAVITYREFYGCQNGKVNEGVRWPATRVAKRVADMERNEKVTYGVIDPSAFKWDGGPSHAERMARVGVMFRKADNNRIGGWDTIRERLCGVVDDPLMGHNGGPAMDPLEMGELVGTPMWYIFSNCVHTIRTLPALQHDLNNMEDCDTDGEDHAPDALRYGLMSRPWSRPKPTKSEMGEILLLQNATLNDIWEDHDAHEGQYQ